MRYPVMGGTTIATLAAATIDHLHVTAGRRLMGTVTLTAGRTLWLRHFGIICGSAATKYHGGFALIDAAPSQSACTVTDSFVKYIYNPTTTIPTANAGLCKIVNFAEPGLKFTTDCSIIAVTTLAGNVTMTATGYYKAWGSGYEE